MVLFYFRCFIFFLVAIVTEIQCKNAALVIIDVQLCFLPNGSLAVPDGDQVIPVINDIRSKHKDKFSLVVLSQDWHCSDHISFASQHNEKNPFEYIQLLYDDKGLLCDSTHNCSMVKYNITQRLWPDHCVINSTSADISSKLTRSSNDIIIKKGYNCKVDSYSAFYDNGKFTHTELDGILKSSKIDTVFVVGLAEDYCVYYTSVDAKELGYETYMVEDASRGVSLDTTRDALANMRKKGVQIIQSSEIGKFLTSPTDGTSIIQHTKINVILTLMVFVYLFL